MNQPISTEHNLPHKSPEFIGPHLPCALESHVSEGRLEQRTAVDLMHEMVYQSEVIALRRDVDRRSNLLFLDNGQTFGKNPLSSTQGMTPEEISRMFREAILSMPQLNAHDAAFRGDASEIGNFLHSLTAAARERFKEESHSLLSGKDSLAFDLDYIDQYGDWGSPQRLDELVRFATDSALLNASFSDDATEITRHDRDHPKIKYEFWRAATRPGGRDAIVVIRKRPYADIVVGSNNDSMCLEIFRKSWFLASADEENTELRDAINHVTFRPPSQEKYTDTKKNKRNKDAKVYIEQLVNNTLDPANDTQKPLQTEVLPCTMTYVVQIRNPRTSRTQPDVE